MVRPAAGNVEVNPTLASRLRRFRNIGLLNDYLRIPYANGSSFATQFFYRELRKRGHDVTVIGPHDAEAQPQDLPNSHLAMNARPLRMHPGVHMSLPKRADYNALLDARFDAVVCQSSSALMEYGVWLRRQQGVPLVCVNTVHLPSVYNQVLPDALNKNRWVNRVFDDYLIPLGERSTVQNFNSADAVVVLAPGMKSYWRDRGVTVPIHVIPRAVEPKLFDREPGNDPFPAAFTRGRRVLVVCRHTREKSVTRLLSLFATEVLPHCPNATLTLVGDGPDHDEFRAHAERLGISENTCFPGEIPVAKMVDWYRHADVFAYTSLSETYGQVVSEALWCGLPAVAFDDEMGVAGQLTSGQDGYLVRPGPNEESANAEFGGRILELLQSPEQRRAMGAHASRLARLRSDPDQCIARLYKVLESARVHCSKARPWETATRWQKVAPKVRMAALHGLVLTLGLLRKPATLNRNGARPAGWDSL